MENTPPHLEPTDPRRHDLDALRAFAMLLGIVLHSALSFMTISWVVQDRSQSPELGLAVSAIHGFRMPLFFLLSGFFTAMLWKKRGLVGLLKNRAMRIALPLGIFWSAISPIMLVIWIWAGAGNANYGAVDTTRDIWTAAANGDLDGVRSHIDQGASLDDKDPRYGVSPLAWAVIGDANEVIDCLLDAGADPGVRSRDRNTPLHTAAFFGRADAAARLLAADADVNAVNKEGETPLDSLRFDRKTTEYIARLIELPIDFDAVSAGRDRIRTMFEEHAAISGLAGQRDVSEDGESDEQPTAQRTGRGILSKLYQALMVRDFFLHLWFLWFLCWLVGAFTLVVVASRFVPRLPIPPALITTPLCLLWLVPLTMLTQSFMHSGGATPGFGPDTSTGLLPMPHVLAHYTIFFGFGALLYLHSGTANRLGRGWWIQLPLALLLLPAGLALALHLPWGNEIAADESTRRLLSNLGQVLYVWLMIFGLIGLCETILNRNRPWVRYVSDSSYWLYLIHLPLVIAGQILLRDLNLPALPKLAILIITATTILLISYHLLVRYTLIGRLLNGPRTRPQRTT